MLILSLFPRRIADLTVCGSGLDQPTVSSGAGGGYDDRTMTGLGKTAIQQMQNLLRTPRRAAIHWQTWIGNIQDRERNGLA